MKNVVFVFFPALSTLRTKKNKDDIIHEKLGAPTSEREGKLSNLSKIFLRKFTETRARAPRGMMPRGCHALFFCRPEVQ
jgi:hypothetical protein